MSPSIIRDGETGDTKISTATSRYAPRAQRASRLYRLFCFTPLLSHDLALPILARSARSALPQGAQTQATTGTRKTWLTGTPLTWTLDVATARGRFKTNELPCSHRAIDRNPPLRAELGMAA